MGCVRLSMGNHYSWLGYWKHLPAAANIVIHRQHITHNLTYVCAGQGAVRALHRSNERKYHLATRAVEFFPADQEHHTFIGEPDSPSDVYFLLIPKTDEAEIAASEGMDPLTRTRPLQASQDPELQRCMARLTSHTSHDAEATGWEGEVCRQLVLRILALSGGGAPDWYADASVFDRRTLGQLVEFVDAHLQIKMSLSDMGLRVGLSPSHFARKFRNSTGLSFHRFMNRRRILASFDALKDRAVPLACTAHDLGFSSQSHMTRLFSDLTGMTPAKFQKQVKPAMA
jgi:AraC-like DNA-binding protein